MHSGISRRVFLRTTALGGLGMLILKNSRSAYSYEANEKLDIALIGVGGRGTWFVDTIPHMENVVALCDVDSRKLTEAFQRWEDGAKRYAASPHEWERKAAESYKRLTETKPKTYRDFRRMLDKKLNLSRTHVIEDTVGEPPLRAPDGGKYGIFFDHGDGVHVIERNFKNT